MYEVVGTEITRTTPAGKRTECKLGEVIALGFDRGTGDIIAHGKQSEVHRLMDLLQDFVRSRPSERSSIENMEILPFPATEETVDVLNQCLEAPVRLTALADMLRKYKPDDVNSLEIANENQLYFR